MRGWRVKVAHTHRAGMRDVLHVDSLTWVNVVPGGRV